MIQTDLFSKIKNIFSENGVEDASFEAAALISYYTGVSIPQVRISDFSKIDKAVEEQIYNSVNERISGIPLQYVIGEWDFMGYTFEVGEGVLIPRPETELLCEFVIGAVKDIESPTVYDLCSGSGCIGISIKKEIPNCEVYLVEKSKDAFVYLEKNLNNICGNACPVAINGDIFDVDSFIGLPLADVIVSNPPYIKTEEMPRLQKEVQREPSIALDGGADGLIFYREIIANWSRVLKKDGIIAFECGEDQADDIAEIFIENKFDISIKEDYNHIKRFVIGRRNIL